MKEFACKDMGMDCDFVATGETVEDVMQQAFAHAQVAHAAVVAEMSSTPEKMAELQGVVASKIH